MMVLYFFSFVVRRGWVIAWQPTFEDLEAAAVAAALTIICMSTMSQHAPFIHSTECFAQVQSQSCIHALTISRYYYIYDWWFLKTLVFNWQNRASSAYSSHNNYNWYGKYPSKLLSTYEKGLQTTFNKILFSLQYDIS